MPHQIYNKDRTQYLQSIEVASAPGVTYDLSIIEFDDHGIFWKIDQLRDAIDLIERRNAESERGVFVIPFVHGWKHNADPDRKTGDLVEFHEELARIAARLAQAESGTPNRVIGVYIGWRGASSTVPFQEQTTFWSRRATAERMASQSMRETLFSIMEATRNRPESKCLVVGHSMGGIVVGKTLSPSLSTLLLASDEGGVLMPADFVVMLNPALDALASWQFIDFLKRSNARLELRTTDGRVLPAPGPSIVSITSEADTATGKAYPFGRTLSNFFTAFRKDHEPPQPSHRFLATHAEGHVDYLVSHRAWMENGELKLERIPGAFNDTPFWVIQVSSDISKDHGDTRNPNLATLIDDLSQMNKLYESDVQVWMTRNTER